MIALVFFIGNLSHQKRANNFGKAVQKIETGEVTLQEITPFAWDAVYTFAPYTPKQEIEEVIGAKSGKISELVNEGMTQLIFVKDGKVICGIQGYADRLGYFVSFLKDGEKQAVINFAEPVVFSVSREHEFAELRIK